MAALSKAPHPWKPVRLPSDRRPACPHGNTLVHLHSVPHAIPGESGAQPHAPRPVRPHGSYRHYSGSLIHCQPRVSWCTARTRKGPAASDSSATTRTSWR